MKDRDPIAQALAALDVPPLDPRFASRVGVLAKVELRAHTRAAPSMAPLRSTLRAALVPALLTLAAIDQTAVTAETIVTIYGKDASPRRS